MDRAPKEIKEAYDDLVYLPQYERECIICSASVRCSAVGLLLRMAMAVIVNVHGSRLALHGLRDGDLRDGIAHVRAYVESVGNTAALSSAVSGSLCRTERPSRDDSRLAVQWPQRPLVTSRPWRARSDGAFYAVP